MLMGTYIRDEIVAVFSLFLAKGSVISRTKMLIFLISKKER